MILKALKNNSAWMLLAYNAILQRNTSFWLGLAFHMKKNSLFKVMDLKMSSFISKVTKL